MSDEEGAVGLFFLFFANYIRKENVGWQKNKSEQCDAGGETEEESESEEIVEIVGTSTKRSGSQWDRALTAGQGPREEEWRGWKDTVLTDANNNMEDHGSETGETVALEHI